jgi:5-methylthioribose kinase
MQLTHHLDKQVDGYLKIAGFISSHETILEYAKAGEGNMNFVVRVKTNEGSVIVKQSRPYVEKYRSIPAPVERILVEKTYYELIGGHAVLASFSPAILGCDELNYTLVMQDLGSGSDYLGLYSRKVEITQEEVAGLIRYLVALHGLEIMEFPANTGMKVLNHEHIFRYPFMEENGFDLDLIQGGLQQLAMKYKTDESLKKQIEKLGERYLSTGNTLLHGDFYPGSWLKVAEGVKVIDPEFAYLGDPEFDLGVMIAHLKMAGLSFRPVIEAYGSERSLSEKLLIAYAGVEIMRRLIGLAQLPVSMDIETKREMLEEASGMISRWNN